MLSIQTSTALSIDIFLSSHTLISMIRLAAIDGVVIGAISCIATEDVESNFRVDDDDE